MLKADDKVKYDGEEKPAKFTNFEELVARVRILVDTIDEHAEILRQNDLIKTTDEDAPYFDEDAVYRELE